MTPNRLRQLPEVVRSDNAVAMLNRLAQSPNGLSDSELRTLLSLDTNNALAGVTASIAKAAVKLGLSKGAALHVSKTKVSGRRGYKYRLTPEMQTAMDSRQGGGSGA